MLLMGKSTKIDLDHSSSFQGALLVLTRQFEDKFLRLFIASAPRRRFGKCQAFRSTGPFYCQSKKVSKGHLKYKNPASCNPQTKRNIYYILQSISVIYLYIYACIYIYKGLHSNCCLIQITAKSYKHMVQTAMLPNTSTSFYGCMARGIH